MRVLDGPLAGRAEDTSCRANAPNSCALACRLSVFELARRLRCAVVLEAGEFEKVHDVAQAFIDGSYA